jgi:branched-chain amino acid transport system substrate-binding protein
MATDEEYGAVTEGEESRQAEISESLFGRLTSRRSVLKGAGSGAMIFAGASLLEACSSSLKGSTSQGSSGKGGSTKITLGFVTPRTGELATFAVSDLFVVNTIRQTKAFDKGVKIGGKTYDIDIVVKDSQSSPNRASQVARELITQDKADMIVVTSTPEVANPVASACESEHVPCVSTVVPWESWYFGRGAKKGTTFKYTTMFFFGIPEFGKCFVPMWNRIPTDKVVAGMFPNDADGNSTRKGTEVFAKAAGYKVVNSAHYTDGLKDYTSMITKFKQHDCEVFINAPLPPDFNTMWKQSAQQGFKPKIATVTKVLLFPSGVAALGDLSVNIATDAWWTPSWPGKSSLDGMTPKQLSDAFTAKSGKQWIQALGSTYALFEVAYEAFKKAHDPHDHDAVAKELRTMNMPNTMDGPLNFTNGPVPGVAIVQPVGGQWKKGTKFPYELEIVDNTANKAVPLTGDLKPTNA